MRVVGDVIIENDVTLTIAPGVIIEFEDYYMLDVAGTLLAVATQDARITFTTDEPGRFRVDESLTGCFNGIRFDHKLATNDRSRLEYCVIQYSKAVSGGGGLHSNCGGAISVTDFSNLTISNCIIRNCVADYGGALFLYRNANPLITGNLFVDNHALGNASAIYCSYSYPRVINNTIIQNPIENENNPYIESCAIFNFLARPVLENNIIRDNEPAFYYMHTQLKNNKAYYTHYNNIQDGEIIGGNIDADPRFINPANDDFHLSPGSPCIDAADNEALPPHLMYDLDGNARFIDDPDTEDTGNGTPPIVDIGAYEFQVNVCPADLTGDDQVNIDDIFAILGLWGKCPDPCPPYCEGDLGEDCVVNIDDIFAILGMWGPCE